MALPHDEGGPEVTGTYRVLAQEPTIQVLPGGTVRDAMTITVQEDVYGVTFSFTISRVEWAGEGTAVAALDYTSWVQQVARHEHVIGIQYAQDLDANALLEDVLYVTVATSAVDQQAVAVVPFSALNTPRAFQIIDDTYNALARNGALTGR